jgi:hypothetical protein
MTESILEIEDIEKKSRGSAPDCIFGTGKEKFWPVS